jgi:predicted acyltransferase (DUF342 family)
MILLVEYFTIVCVLIAIPLIPVIMAVREKKDYAPLPVNLEYTKDPRAIAKYFDQYFADSFAEDTLQAGDIPKSKKLGTLEVVGDTFNKSTYKNMVYLLSSVKIPKGLRFEREVISRNELEVGDGCYVRVIKAEKKLKLGRECCIVRWIDAEGPIIVGENSHINIAGSSSTIHLAKGVTFNRLYGLPILTSPNFDFKKNLQHIRDEHLDEAAIEENLLYLPNEEYKIKKDVKIFRSMVTQGDLLIESDVKIFGSIKTNGDIFLDENCFVDGNIIAEGDITIGKNCFITGNLFSRGRILISPYTQIGTSESTKSVIAQKEIHLAEHVAIFNYLLTDKSGKVV